MDGQEFAPDKSEGVARGSHGIAGQWQPLPSGKPSTPLLYQPCRSLALFEGESG